MLQKALHSDTPRTAVSLDWAIHDPALRLELPVTLPWEILCAILVSYPGGSFDGCQLCAFVRPDHFNSERQVITFQLISLAYEVETGSMSGSGDIPKRGNKDLNSASQPVDKSCVAKQGPTTANSSGRKASSPNGARRFTLISAV